MHLHSKYISSCTRPIIYVAADASKTVLHLIDPLLGGFNALHSQYAGPTQSPCPGSEGEVNMLC